MTNFCEGKEAIILNWRERIIRKKFIITDIFSIITITFIFSYLFIDPIREGFLNNNLELIGYITLYLLISLELLNAFKVYRHLLFKHGGSNFLDALYTVLIFILSTIIVALIMKFIDVEFSISFYIIYTGIIIVAILMNRLIFHFLRDHNSQFGSENILIIGYSKRGEEYIKEIQKRKYLDLKIVGYLNRDKAYTNIKYLGKIEDFGEIIKRQVVDEVTVTNFIESAELMSEIIEYSKNSGITVNLLFQDHETSVFKSHVEMVGKIATIKLHLVSLDEYQLFIKRIMDLIIGFLGFIVFLILYIIIGPIIKLDSKGPILFKQDRIGKHGRIFKVYKFRTMIDNAEAQKEKMMNQNKMKGPIFKIDNDPRITKFGKFLRKTSIDEFPQFINVLKGDMSVVGTRPPTLEEVKRYKADEFQRISIVPGITGMWQVNGRSDVTDFKKILQIERDYIQNWSVTLDLFIILKTIKVVILCQGSE